ncbi:Putative bacteriophage protein [Salmonella enterica subsp. enterica serovar Wandsworth str. A4-580]|nr:Putative bacteriophage protein [Salmonella enterica subsp. enterica serovar Hvittingfoss str. A4-620]EHD03844.1 Putative bacteriophage protein [Salmonella enterica subsp. enterica serovar Wandsworth str. A4-580]
MSLIHRAAFLLHTAPSELSEVRLMKMHNDPHSMDSQSIFAGSQLLPMEKTSHLALSVGFRSHLA